MMRVVTALAAAVLVASANGHPLQWFDEDSPRVEDSASAVPHDLAHAVEMHGGMSPADAEGAVSFLQTTTQGHPLECDCERVKCNCVKRCECGLPPSAQNRAATAFLELIGGSVGGDSTPLLVDMDTNECFLETGEKVGQDQHHMLDCECDKVKCNCVKHCECSLPSAAGGAGASANNMLVQKDEGLEAPKAAVAAADNTLIQVAEGAAPSSGDFDDDAHVPAAVADDNEEGGMPTGEDVPQTTDQFLASAGAVDGPSDDDQVPTKSAERSRQKKKSSQKVGNNKGKKSAAKKKGSSDSEKESYDYDSYYYEGGDHEDSAYEGNYEDGKSDGEYSYEY